MAQLELQTLKEVDFCQEAGVANNFEQPSFPLLFTDIFIASAIDLNSSGEKETHKIVLLITA